MTDVVKKLGLVVTLENGQLVAKQLKDIGEAGQQAKKSGDELNNTLRDMAGIIAGIKLSEWAKDTVSLAARYQTLGVALDVVGRSAGKTTAQLADIQAGLQKTGISVIESRANMLKLIQAHIDLGKANDLARVAQNAAVLQGENSSEVFARMIHGIQSGHVIILRNIGLGVEFERAYKKLAQTLGTTTEALTDEQRMAARVNDVMRAGEPIASAYGAAFGTAGKQIKSAERYLEDARVAAGTAILPEYTIAVFAYADALKMIGRHAPEAAAGIVAVAASITTLGVVLKASAIMSFFAAPVTAAALGSLAAFAGSLAIVGTTVYKLAHQVFEARRANEEYMEQLRAMSTEGLKALQAGYQEEIKTTKSIERFKELTKYIADVTAQIKANTEAEKIANAAKANAPIGPEVNKIIETRQFELQKLKDLNAAYGQSALQIKEIEIRYEALSRVQKDREGHNDKEIAALNAQTFVWEQQTRLAAVLESNKKLTEELDAAWAKYGDRTIEVNGQIRVLIDGMNALGGSLSRVRAMLPQLTPDSTGAFANAIGDQLKGIQYTLKPALLPPDGGVEKHKQYVKDIETIWHDGIGRIVTDGFKSYHDFFEDVLRLFSSLMKRMEQEHKSSMALNLGSAAIVGGLTGYGIGSQIGDSTGGALAGAGAGALAGSSFGPWGAAIGGLVGAAGGLIGGANAHKEAAERLKQAAEALDKNITAYALESNPAAVALENEHNRMLAFHDAMLHQARSVYGDEFNPGKGIRAGATQEQYDQYLQQQERLQQAYKEHVAKIQADFWNDVASRLNSLDGPAGAYRNSLAELNRWAEEARKSADALGASDAQRAQIEEILARTTEQLKAAEANRVQQISLELDAREAAARGNDDEAAAIRRRAQEEQEIFAAQQAGWTAEQIARLQYIQGLEDQAAAEAKAAAAAERATQSMASLTERFLRLTGQGGAADWAALFERQRQEQKKAGDDHASPADLAMLNLVQIFERGELTAKQEISKQTDAINAQLAAAQQAQQILQASLQAQQQLVNNTRQTVETLRRYSDSLKLGQLSPLSPRDRYLEAKRQYDTVEAAASAGDQAAAARLPDIANAFLEQSRFMFSSTAKYQQDFQRVVGDATALADKFGLQLTVEERMLAQLETQNNSMQQQIALLQEQLARLQDANAIAEATRTAVIAELEKSRDAGLAPNGQLIDVFNNLRDTLTGVGRDVVTAERDILVGNQNSLTQATQAEIDAIRAGDTAEHIAQLDQIRILTEQKTAVDGGFARQVEALGTAFGYDSPQVMEIIRLQQRYDDGVTGQINALKAVDETVQRGNNSLDFAAIPGLDRVRQALDFGTSPRLEWVRDAVNGGLSGTSPIGSLLSQARDAIAYTNTRNWGIRGYATGGDFGGGIMRVGEHGEELVATGAARVHTAQQLNADVVKELTTQTAVLRKELAELRRELRTGMEGLRGRRSA